MKTAAKHEKGPIPSDFKRPVVIKAAYIDWQQSVYCYPHT